MILKGISAVSTKYDVIKKSSNPNVTGSVAQGDISYQKAQEFQRKITNGDKALMEAAEGHTIVYTDEEGRLRFQRAWHGTGTDFEHFSTEHTEKCEGQQAFGWGL